MPSSLPNLRELIIEKIEDKIGRIIELPKLPNLTRLTIKHFNDSSNQITFTDSLSKLTHLTIRDFQIPLETTVDGLKAFSTISHFGLNDRMFNRIQILVNEINRLMNLPPSPETECSIL